MREQTEEDEEEKEEEEEEEEDEEEEEEKEKEGMYPPWMLIMIRKKLVKERSRGIHNFIIHA